MKMMIKLKVAFWEAANKPIVNICPTTVMENNFQIPTLFTAKIMTNLPNVIAPQKTVILKAKVELDKSDVNAKMEGK